MNKDLVMMASLLGAVASMGNADPMRLPHRSIGVAHKPRLKSGSRKAIRAKRKQQRQARKKSRQ